MLPPRGTVHTRAPRPRDDVLRAYGGLAVASVHEAMGQRNLLRGPRPLAPGTRAVGRAVTALDLSGSNLTLHAMLEVAGPGDFLVWTSQHGPVDSAVWGANVSESAAARGLAGAVIEGHARDIAGIERIGFPLWALGVTPAATGKTRVGWGNVPVVCCGAYVRPGDVIVADADGVAVVPLEDAARVAEGAASRDLRETTTLTPRVRAGESLFAVRDWSGNFPADGGRFVDAAWDRPASREAGAADTENGG